tara:strand:+ start:481 stop:771 length:291 start_codon:yes stop_codon:yes gene_type:complete
MDLDNVSEPKNEGQYLELCNQLKETYDTISEKCFRLEMEQIEHKKILMCCYGLIRSIDNMTEHVDIPIELLNLIETLRGFMSGVVEYHILGIKDSI